jgi:sigma-E factor negative regulatory protein RseA
MTDTLKEQLSAFLDGELPEAETTLLLKRLERDDELKGALSRYSLIGAVLRTEGDVPAARHVAARVSAAIAQEPAFATSPRSRWLRPVAGLAMAASVAAATVALLPQWLGEELPAATIAAVEPVGSMAQAPAAVLASSTVVATADEPAETYTTPRPTAESSSLSTVQLASFLVAHSGYVSPLGRRSIVTNVAVDDPEVAAEPAILEESAK